MHLEEDLDELNEVYDELIQKNKQLIESAKNLKNILNEYKQISNNGLSEIGPENFTLNNKIDSFSNEEFKNIGKSLAKMSLTNGNDALYEGYRLSTEILAKHKEEIFAGFTNIFEDFFGGFRASGGSVSPGKSYIVGERGSEIFKPTSRGNIARNNSLNINNRTNFIKKNFQENEWQIIKNLLNQI